jgi:hypothetical protein
LIHLEQSAGKRAAGRPEMLEKHSNGRAVAVSVAASVVVAVSKGL